MTNAEALTQFFEAENTRDWARYVTFLHPEVVWELHGDGVRVIRGVEEYLAVITAAYSGTDIRFRCERMDVSADGNRIVTHLVNDQGDRSVDIFEFEDGKIVREFEFLLD